MFKYYTSINVKCVWWLPVGIGLIHNHVFNTSLLLTTIFKFKEVTIPTQVYFEIRIHYYYKLYISTTLIHNIIL